MQIANDEQATGTSESVGIIRRDLLRLLQYLDHGDLECKNEVRAVVLMFGVCSMAYLHDMNKDALLSLFAKMLSDFNPDEVMPTKDDKIQ